MSTWPFHFTEWSDGGVSVGKVRSIFRQASSDGVGQGSCLPGWFASGVYGLLLSLTARLLPNRDCGGGTEDPVPVIGDTA